MIHFPIHRRHTAKALEPEPEPVYKVFWRPQGYEVKGPGYSGAFLTAHEAAEEAAQLNAEYERRSA